MEKCLYCEDKFIKKGGRKAKKMSQSDFKTLFLKTFRDPLKTYADNCFDTYTLLSNAAIWNDLKKIQFDSENFITYFDTDIYKGKDFVGFNEVNGLSFLGVVAGGDWENPLFFIVYYDGKKFRAYIPTAGNVFHITTKTAFGSQEDGYMELAEKKGATDESAFILKEEKKFLKDYLHLSPSEVDKVIDDCIEIGAHECFDLEFNWEWIIKDIASRIEVLD